MNEVLIGILLSLLVVTLYFSACWVEQRKLVQNCRTLREQLRKVEGELRELQSARASFEPYRDEPFMTALPEVDAELERYKIKLETALEQYVLLAEQVASLKRSPLRDVRKKWNWLWLRALQARCVQAIEESRILGEESARLDVRFHQMRELPWSIALQVREALNHLQQADGLLKELAALGGRGEAYDRLFLQAREIGQNLRNVPVYFLSESRERLLAEANPEDIRKVYQIVQADSPRLLEILRQAEHWKDQYLSLESQLKLAEAELGRLTQVLAHFPEEVDLAEEKKTVEEWKNRLDELCRRREALSLEEVPTFVEELSAFVHDVRSFQQKLRQGRQRAYQLRRLQSSLAELEKETREQFEALSQAVLKVKWDLSGERYRRTLEKFRILQAVARPYSLAELERICARAWMLQENLLELRRHIADVAKAHQVCERIYTSPEIRAYEQWLQVAKKLAEEIRPYDPRNFPHRDWTLNFDRQIQEIEAQLKGIVQWIEGDILLESSIGEVAQAMEEIHRQVVTFQERMTLIEQVYRHLVHLERESLAFLKTVRHQFAQMTQFVLAQPLLAERVEREIIQLDRKFDLCEVAFQQRGKDTVLRKQARLNQLTAELEQAANRWLSIVENDCLRLLDDLARRLAWLDQIAHFGDPLIDRARELIARKEELLNFRTGRVQVPLDQLVGAMKTVFDAWQEGFAISKQLAEQVEAPLLSTYQEFQGLRQEVRVKLSKVESLIPSQRKWPPNSLSLTVEKNEIFQLEEKWKSLQEAPGSVIQFVKNLGEMVAGYRGLLEKLLQYEQWALQEQSRIERIETEIYRLDRLWEIQQRRFRQIPEIASQIQELRQRANQELATLRQYWLTNSSRRPPSIDYDVVLRRLIELSRFLANAKVYWVNEEGEEEAMDINGQILQKS